MQEEDRIYPPRFEVQVCGSQAREPITALICFRGMADIGSDTTELVLEPVPGATIGGLSWFPCCSFSCSVILHSFNAGTPTAALEIQPPYHMIHYPHHGLSTSMSTPTISTYYKVHDAPLPAFLSVLRCMIAITFLGREWNYVENKLRKM